MMKSMIRYLAICLAAFIVFGSSGCSSKKSPAEGEGFKGQKEEIVDLGGRLITVGVWNESQVPKQDDSGITNESQKQVNSVALKRQQEAETKLNCKIEWKLFPNNYYNTILTDMKAGKNIADIVYLISYNGILSMIQGDLLTPLDDYIDFSSGLYGNEAQKASLWMGKHYGLYVNQLRTGQGILTYNKTLIQQQGFTDPFQLQQSGQWTWDMFLDIARATTKDINGDGVTDQWGLIDTRYYNVYQAFLFSNGADFTKEKDGKIRYALLDEDAKEALEFVTALYKTHKVVKEYAQFIDEQRAANPQADYQSIYQAIRNFVLDGKCAFYSSTLAASNELGYVVCPKGPKATDYVTYDSGGSYYSIPSTTKEPEKVAAVMKMLFSYFDSSKTDFLPQSSFNTTIDAEVTYKLSADKIHYSWFIQEPTYRDAFSGVFDNMYKGKTTVEAVGTPRYWIERNFEEMNSKQEQ